MMKKKTRITACLMAGVLVLGVSAGAAFGSANGYSSYKDAVMALALEEENFTAQGAMSLKVDGKELLTADIRYAQDGVNRSIDAASTEYEDSTHYFDTTLNGTEIWFNEEDPIYHQAQVERSDTTLFGYDQSDEWNSRMVNFLSLAADTVAGELKNNFVQVGKEDGKTLYQVSIAGSQVPSLVNAGLSLFAYSTAGDHYNNDGYMTFDKYHEAEIAYYEKTTGKTVSDAVREAKEIGYSETFYQEHEAEMDAISEAGAVMWDHYNEILNEKGNVGVLYIKNDGSYDYYATWQEYVSAHREECGLDYYVAQEMTLQKVDCDFALDKDSRLTDNTITATFQTTDAEGGHHTLEITGTVAVTDYGTTQIQPLDTGDRTRNT